MGMVQDTQREMFTQGLKAYDEGRTLAALPLFEQAMQSGETNDVESYFGYCIAKERGQTKRGLELCEKAMKRDAGNTANYLNLGRVYLLLDRREEAIYLFRKGLAVGFDHRIVTELNDMGIRRRPVFRFLKRSNPINIMAGLLLKRLGSR